MTNFLTALKKSTTDTFRFVFTVFTGSLDGINATSYVSVGGVQGLNNSTTESAVDTPITFAFTVTRNRATININAKNANTVFAFRDDGSSIGALTVSASTTGEFDSGALTTSVVAGSKVNYLSDTSLSASGDLRGVLLTECSN